MRMSNAAVSGLCVVRVSMVVQVKYGPVLLSNSQQMQQAAGGQ